MKGWCHKSGYAWI